MPHEIGALAAELLREPVKVSVTPAAKTADRVDQQVIFVEQVKKRAMLVELFSNPDLTRTLVFTRTKRGADRVARHLETAGIAVAAIHGNKSQAQREMALWGFKSAKIRALIATDVAARGIDIDAVSHVINYEIPNIPESYVHRIGRTARAGAEGIAISLVDAEERDYLRDIERLTRQTIPSVDRRGDATLIAPVEPRGSTDDSGTHGDHRRGARTNHGRGDRREGHREERSSRAGHNGHARRADHSHADIAHGDRAQAERHHADRAQGDRPHTERPHSDRPNGDRTYGDRVHSARLGRPRPGASRPGEPPRHRDHADQRERPMDVGNRDHREVRGPRADQRDSRDHRREGPSHDGPRHEGHADRGPRRDRWDPMAKSAPQHVKDRPAGISDRPRPARQDRPERSEGPGLANVRFLNEGGSGDKRPHRKGPRPSDDRRNGASGRSDRPSHGGAKHQGTTPRQRTV